MTAVVGATSRFEIGRVASRTFGVIGRNLSVFGLLALLLAGIPEGAARYLNAAVIKANGWEAALVSLAASLLSFAGVCLLQASLIHGAVADLNGRKASFGDCLATGAKFVWPVIGLSILTGVICGIGFILFIVPGVMMATAWCVNIPVVVTERSGVFAAFGRSADLTRGYRWPIFGLMLIFVVTVWITDALGAVLSGGLDFHHLAKNAFDAPTWAVLTGLQVVQSLIAAAGVAAIYYELRAIKEGIGPATLAAVFD